MILRPCWSYPNGLSGGRRDGVACALALPSLSRNSSPAAVSSRQFWRCSSAASNGSNCRRSRFSPAELRLSLDDFTDPFAHGLAARYGPAELVKFTSRPWKPGGGSMDSHAAATRRRRNSSPVLGRRDSRLGLKTDAQVAGRSLRPGRLFPGSAPRRVGREPRPDLLGSSCRPVRPLPAVQTDARRHPLSSLESLGASAVNFFFFSAIVDYAHSLP